MKKGEDWSGHPLHRVLAYHASILHTNYIWHAEDAGVSLSCQYLAH